MENKNVDSNIEKNDINSSVMEPESVTREINLDELYDGAINNTVVIDPITKDEVLIEPKKANGKVFGIFVAILVLLVLYFVNNKMDFENNGGNVAPATTTTTTTTNAQHSIETLTCTYTSTSSSDNQKATYIIKYDNNKILNSSFNYDVVTISETVSESVLELMSEYENSYINNSALTGGNVNFEKNDKGFMYSSTIDYTSVNFDEFLYEEGKTKLYAKPNAIDTMESVKEIYTNKGYSCIVSSDDI